LEDRLRESDLSRLLLLTVLAIAAVYLAVWPHELGHAGAAWLLGCKADPWSTGTRWFLWGSRGGDLDFACLARRGRTAQTLTILAGILVNLFLIGIAALAGVWRKRWPWWLAATVLWSLANYAEAFSYLTLNTLWLSSDMAGVVTATGTSRWAWLAAGLLGGGLIGRGLLPQARRSAASLAGDRSARFWMGFFLAYTVGVMLAAAVNRIVLG
jgi:hypothetical protein